MERQGDEYYVYFEHVCLFELCRGYTFHSGCADSLILDGSAISFLLEGTRSYSGCVDSLIQYDSPIPSPSSSSSFPSLIIHSFEHVFMGEIKGESPVVLGMHNWLKIYVEERLRRFDYKGYIHPRMRGGRVQDPLNTEQLIAVNFTWQGVEKDASTIFIGMDKLPH